VDAIAAAPAGDGVSAATASRLEADIRQAQAALARAVTVGHLTGDPVATALEAMSITLGAQLALHTASTGHLRDVSARLDRQTGEALTRADAELSARTAAIAGQLIPRLVRATEHALSARLWTVKLQTMASVAGVAVVLAALTFGAGYWIGTAVGEDMGWHTRAAIVAAASRDGPIAAKLWAQLMANNDPRTAFAACERSVVQQGGQRACALPVWLDPPAPPDHR
jgi:hypothetical protein